ncbi:16S rRNA (cytosine(967)-C(5))-methyltransferase RsmB [Peptoniphilaceae bacterium SGI.131]
MEVIIKARKLAALAVENIIDKGKFSTEEISKFLSDVENSEESFFRQLVYGVVENIYFIDNIIKNSSDIALKKIDKFALSMLRVAIYEMYFLTSKEYAVINEAVNLVKEENFHAKNFVNALLRNISRDKKFYSEIKTKDKIKNLSIKYSFNEDLVKYLLEIYGNENIEDVLKAFNEKASFSIRVNTMKISRQDLIERLSQKGIESSPSDFAKDAIVVNKPLNMTELDEFKEGYFTIQDQSSIYVSEVLDPKPASMILDICAAPGSKSSHLLQISKDEAKIIANDVSSNKLKFIRENFDRMGLKNYQISQHDARVFNEYWEEKFDYILVDAPCSGLGVIRRKPEIKIQRTLKDIKNLAEIQSDILESSFRYLKKGGYLVYSTCTVGVIENESVIKRFIKKHPEMELIKINNEKYFKISPINSNADSFFVAKMHKID